MRKFCAIGEGETGGVLVRGGVPTGLQRTGGGRGWPRAQDTPLSRSSLQADFPRRAHSLQHTPASILPAATPGGCRGAGAPHPVPPSPPRGATPFASSPGAKHPHMTSCREHTPPACPGRARAARRPPGGPAPVARPHAGGRSPHTDRKPMAGALGTAGRACGKPRRGVAGERPGARGGAHPHVGGSGAAAQHAAAAPAGHRPRAMPPLPLAGGWRG